MCLRKVVGQSEVCSNCHWLPCRYYGSHWLKRRAGARRPRHSTPTSSYLKHLRKTCTHLWVSFQPSFHPTTAINRPAGTTAWIRRRDVVLTPTEIRALVSVFFWPLPEFHNRAEAALPQLISWPGGNPVSFLSPLIPCLQSWHLPLLTTNTFRPDLISCRQPIVPAKVAFSRNIFQVWVMGLLCIV